MNITFLFLYKHTHAQIHLAAVIAFHTLCVSVNVVWEGCDEFCRIMDAGSRS